MLKITQEYEAVKAVIKDYIDGANGDMEVLKRAYHKDSIINAAPIQRLFDSVAYYGKTDASARVDFVDISGRAASAKVIVEDWHGNNYVEYLHLLKQNDKWQIVSKVFDTYFDTYVK